MAEDSDGIAFIEETFVGLDDGFLVDVGAHDGVEIGSMSRGLIKRGWSGLMVEPLKAAFDKLTNAYRGNKRVTCMCVACSDEEGTATLYPCRGVSTLNKAWADECEKYWKHVNYGKPCEVPVMRLSKLLASLREFDKCGPCIDYLQVDTEGHDLHVLKGMDWSFSPRVVCVETLDMVNRERRTKGGRWAPDPELSAYLSQQGYELKMLTKGGNGIYMRAGE